MEVQDAYRKKMGAQLREWSAQINLLEARLDNLGGDLRVKGAGELHELRTRQRAAGEKMKELGKSTGEAWDEAKGTADKMWDDFKTGLTDAQSRLK
jgi:hypothetical protein